MVRYCTAWRGYVDFVIFYSLLDNICLPILKYIFGNAACVLSWRRLQFKCQMCPLLKNDPHHSTKTET